MDLKKLMLSLAVGILAALFIGFLIEAIYTSPQHDDFCNREFESPRPVLGNKDICDYKYDTELRNQCMNEKGMIVQDFDENGCVIEETCDYCNKEYREASEIYNRNLFYITAPIGLILIILGLYISVGIDAIAGGILLGGILTMIQITTRIFNDLDKWPRVILLGLELAIVIWIGIKKVHKKK